MWQFLLRWSTHLHEIIEQIVCTAAPTEVASIGDLGRGGGGFEPGSGIVRLGQDPVQYRIYVSNEYSADVTVIDPRTNEVIGTIPISGRPGDVRPRGMAVSADGTLIYIAVSDFNPEFETSEDKIVAIDVRTNEVVREFRAGGNPERLALSPDGERDLGKP